MSKLYLDRHKLTNKILSIVNLPLTPEHASKLWWVNPRRTGGLGLTAYGHSAFIDAGLQYWDLDSSGIQLQSNRMKLIMDRFFPCPYYVLGSGVKCLGLRVWDSRIVILVNLHGGLKNYLGNLELNRTTLA